MCRQLDAEFQHVSDDNYINGNDVGTWIGHNWMWVIGLIILLIVIIAAGGRKRRTRTTTTTIRRDDGNVTRTTTIEGE